MERLCMLPVLQDVGVAVRGVQGFDNTAQAGRVMQRLPGTAWQAHLCALADQVSASA